MVCFNFSDFFYPQFFFKQITLRLQLHILEQDVIEWKMLSVKYSTRTVYTFPYTVNYKYTYLS